MKIIYSKPLDKYEEELEEFLNIGEFVSLPKKDLDEEKKMLSEGVKRYFEKKKSRMVALRVKNENLYKFKVRAQKVGVPYQSVINTFIEQWGNNQIKLAI